MMAIAGLDNLFYIVRRVIVNIATDDDCVRSPWQEVGQNYGQMFDWSQSVHVLQ
jgi:hypothetical protein